MAPTYGSFCTIIETNEFEEDAKRIFSQDDLDGLFDFLSTHPEAGVVITGGGGIRKLRWGRAGRGKSGGARVIYFHRKSSMIVTLLAAFAKNRKSDLTPDELATMRKGIEEMD